MAEKKKHKFWAWLTRPYQFVIYRDGNFEVLKKFRMNKIIFSLVIVTMFLIFFAIISALVVYTPLKYLVPGYPDHKTLELIYENAERVDSLSAEIEAREEYLNMIHDIIFSEVPVDADFAVPVSGLTDEQIRDFNDPTKPRQRYDDAENVNVVDKNDIVPNLFIPMKGMIVNQFDKVHRHFGIDIAPMSDVAVFAVLPGIVIESNYTIDNGYSVILQHARGILSVYKHCEVPSVKEGQKVRQGEQIAVYGNSGENTSGPHLHFELWQNGEPLNPTDYIEF
ncbi:MAG: M23 family metallopeptidase [Bacteroidales bacterium]|nr:M23 family metallopeptidase [Bacteroidales bacterium]